MNTLRSIMHKAEKCTLTTQSTVYVFQYADTDEWQYSTDLNRCRRAHAIKIYADGAQSIVDVPQQ